MALEAKERPKNLRTILLAYPKATRITKKYVPPRYKPGIVESGVKPSAISGPIKSNWRLEQLSKSNSHKISEKYVFVPEPGVGSGVSPAALVGQGTSRTVDLSRPVYRCVVDNKKLFQFLGQPFMKNICKIIDESWNSIYNYYKRQLIEVRKKRRLMRWRRLKASKPRPKKSQKELYDEKKKRNDEWCALRAQPKRVILPEPLRRRKNVNLEKLQHKMYLLSIPRIVTNKFIRPSQDMLFVDPTRVRPSAKKYVATLRITELAESPPFKLIKEIVKTPGAVKRSALTCEVSPRFAELAEPKKKAAEKDSDLKDNPFEISRNALKYRATERIQELAKPVDR